MLRTSRKRLRSKLKRVKEWAKANRSRASLRDLWAAFRRKLEGHVAYYGVSFNLDPVSTFIREATRILFRWLNRRGGRHSLTWDKFNQFMERHPPPKARIRHLLLLTGTAR